MSPECSPCSGVERSVERSCAVPAVFSVTIGIGLDPDARGPGKVGGRDAVPVRQAWEVGYSVLRGEIHGRAPYER